MLKEGQKGEGLNKSKGKTKGMRKKFKGGGWEQRDKKLEWDEKERKKT